MKNKKKLLIITVAVLLTIFIALPALLFSIVNWGILPPKKLTPIVQREINKIIDGHFECEKIELTFFESYPRLGIKIVDGHIISHAIKDSSLHTPDKTYTHTDSLLSFAEIRATIRPLDYLNKGQLTIGEIILDHPRFYGFIEKNGNANWNIYVSKTDSTSEPLNLPPIDLKKVKIEGGHFVYDDLQTNMYAEISGFSLLVGGSLIDGGNTFGVETTSSSILFESPSYSLKNDLALAFKGTVELTDNFNTVTLHGAEIMVNSLPFNADGAVTILPETKNLGINLEMDLKASDMNDLLQFVPESYLKNMKELKANGAVYLNATVQGELGDSIIPTVDLQCKVDEGSFFMEGVRQGIEALEMDLNLHIDGEDINASFVTLDKLTMTGLNTSLDVKGKVTDLLESPGIDTSIKGNIDFTRIAEEFLHPDTLYLHGQMDADMEATFRLNDLLDGKYNNIKALGKMNIDTLIAFSKPYSIDVFISDAHFEIDSTKMTSRFIEGDNLLNAKLAIDSINIKYKDDINTNISRLEMTAKTSPEIDTTAVISVTSHIRIDRMRSRLPDSTWVVASKAYFQGGIRPSASNKMIPNIIGSITTDTLRYFAVPLRTGVVLANSRFTVEALPFRDAMRQRIQAIRKDSTRTVAGRDTTAQRVRHNRTGRQAQIDTTDTSKQLLRNWEVRGSVRFDQARIFSRLFPLPMRMEKTNVKFDTNNITFSDALFHAGKSDFTLNGDISSIRRAMLRGGKLKGNFSVSSDYVDCTQLLQAMSKGMLYAEEQMSRPAATAIDNEHIIESDINSIQHSLSDSSADSAAILFVIPAYLDMAFNMNAKQIDYNDLKMENVVGEIVMRNQSINLKKLDMDSNIGHGNVTMFYTAKEQQGATAGIDMEMQSILVDKLIDLYPSIDTLLPMLRSFEGIVDCEMSLTCDIDSGMSVILPSINTACFLRGKNMVLLDGETFTEISKTLMFKNKKRNVIDNISVDLAIRNNKIEVFPFLLEMDRYRVAIGGTHNLDMTFNYHLSVLKSPVPFKLGIDITGNLDNFKYKITKCKYKNTFDPAKEMDLIAEKTNIREGIRELIRKQIVENAPELADNFTLSGHLQTDTIRSQPVL